MVGVETNETRSVMFIVWGWGDERCVWAFKLLEDNPDEAVLRDLMIKMPVKG